MMLLSRSLPRHVVPQVNHPPCEVVFCMPAARKPLGRWPHVCGTKLASLTDAFEKNAKVVPVFARFALKTVSYIIATGYSETPGVQMAVIKLPDRLDCHFGTRHGCATARQPVDTRLPPEYKMDMGSAQIPESSYVNVFVGYPTRSRSDHRGRQVTEQPFFPAG